MLFNWMGYNIVLEHLGMDVVPSMGKNNIPRCWNNVPLLMEKIF